MLHLTGADFPFQTSNAALGLALYLAGIPWHDNACPLVNIYDSVNLKALGYSGPIEQSAMLAFSEGIKGNVEYGFKQTVHLGDVIQGFNDATVRIKAGETSETVFTHTQTALAGAMLSKAIAIGAATSAVLRVWRQDIKTWQAEPDFCAQRRKQAIRDFDGAELATSVFLTGSYLEYAAVVMDARKAFLHLFTRVEPYIRVRKLGQRAGDETMVKLPGFVFYNRDTENSTRRNLGIPTK